MDLLLQRIGTSAMLWPAIVALAAVLTAIGALAVALSTRRRFVRDAGRLVVALEAMRRGGQGLRPTVEPDSPLARVADSVERLQHDLSDRWSEVERAKAGWIELTGAARQTAFVTTDADGDLRGLSAGAEALVGWSEGELVSRPVAVLFDEPAYKELLPKLGRKSLREQGIVTRSVLRRKDGSRIDVEVSVRQVSGTDGGGFLMVLRDLGEQLRVEGELQRETETLRELVDELGEPLLILADGRVAWANRAAEGLFGRAARAIVGLRLRDCLATRDVIVVDELLGTIESGGRSESEFSCRLLDPSGAFLADVRIRAAAIRHEGRRAVRLLLHDRTAQSRAQAELQIGQLRLDAVIESTSDALLLLDDRPEGRRVFLANAALAEMVGLPLSQVLGATAAELTRRLRETGAVGAAIASIVERSADEPVDERILTAGDDGRALWLRAQRLSGRVGRELGLVVVCRDLSEQKRTERQLQLQAEQLQLGKLELERAYRGLSEAHESSTLHGEDLERLNRELRRLDEMKSNLLGNVSHELQTPLVSIRGYTEMILKERLGPINHEQRQGLTLALKNIDRLIGMIDGLLALGRDERDLGRIALSRFPLEDVVSEAEALMRDRASAKNLGIDVDLAGSAFDLEADRDKILQVFLNLLSNAIKHSPEGGRIRIRAELADTGFATVRVGDSGAGIPKEDLARIFQRHYQVAGEGRARPVGEGLGLAIVREILLLHGCRIHAESEPGCGAEFVFTLPLHGDYPRVAAPVPERQATQENSPPPGDQDSPGTRRGEDARDDSERVPRLRIIRRTGDDRTRRA